MIRDDDRLVIEMLKSVADASIVHSVVHYLYFPLQADALAAVDTLTPSGFAVESGPAIDGRWYVISRHRIVPSESNIAMLREQMEAIARDRGEYDGWEVDLT